MRGSRLINRNVIAARGRTSMRLEPELWDAIAEVCARERISASQLCRQAEAAMPGAPRTSAIRVYLIAYYRAAATADGHAEAGHGRLPVGWRAEEGPTNGPAPGEAQELRPTVPASPSPVAA